MKTLVITVNLDEKANLEDLAEQTKEFLNYLESSDLTVGLETDNSDLEGILPKPKKPNA